MRTIVDSSVWISHFKKPDQKLISLLEVDEVILHPFIIQELYLGRPKGKEFVFERLTKLPQVPIISETQFLKFVSQYKVSGKGIGAVDVHLLGSAYLNKLKMYTLDKSLHKLAETLL